MEKYRNNIIILFLVLLIICISYFAFNFNDNPDFNNFCLSLTSGLIVSIVVSYNDYISEWEIIKNKLFNSIAEYFMLLFECKHIIYIIKETDDDLCRVIDDYISNKVNGGINEEFYDKIAFLSPISLKLKSQIKKLDFEIMRTRLLVNISIIAEENDNKYSRIEKILTYIDDETNAFDNMIQAIDNLSIRNKWRAFKNRQAFIINYRDMKVNK